MFVIVAVLCVKCCGCDNDNIVCYNVLCVCDSGNVVCISGNVMCNVLCL